MKANQAYVCLLAAALIITLSTPTWAQGIYQLWGTTQIGGSTNAGVIFSTKYDGTNLQKQADMAVASGSFPSGKLLLYNNKLYGLARFGGTMNYGSLFEYDLLTKSYTKRTDLDSINGKAPLGGTLIEYNDKLYGLTTQGGKYDKGVIFEYNPATNTIVKKIEFNGTNGRHPQGGMLLYNNKMYGISSGGNSTDGGVLFEYDPNTNTYSIKYQFSSAPNGRAPAYNLLLHNNKLWGMTSFGGTNNAGTIFEFDPATDIFTKRYNFLGSSNGVSPYGGLCAFNDHLYGFARGGASSYGVLFDFDPSTNIFTKMFDFHWNKNTGTYPTGSLTVNNYHLFGVTAHDGASVNQFSPTTGAVTMKSKFTGPNGSNPEYVTLLPIPAPVASGVLGSCQTVDNIIINASNANQWVPITNEKGDAVAEINANGNVLGNVSTQIYVHNGTVRKDGSNRPYLDRNITITPQFQPSTPVSVRLYIKGTEYKSLRDAANASGLFLPVTSISNIGVFKNSNTCSDVLTMLTTPITGSSGNSWGLYEDYVFSVNVNAFSTFYFAPTDFIILPIQLISFNVTVKNNMALLEWVTKEEGDGRHFMLEYSKDGNSFNSIAIIPAAGLDSENKYQYPHGGLTNGAHYYRIKIVNSNGSFTYSPIKRVNILHEYPLSLKLQTNPIVSQPVVQFTATYPQQVQVSIYTSNGQRVWHSSYKLTTSTQIIKFPLSLSKGHYMLIADNGETVQKVTFVKP